jgi:hypothetical protein
MLSQRDSIEADANNVKLFVTAAISHARAQYSTSPLPAGLPGAFYWINVLGGRENPMWRLLPLHLPCVGVVSVSAASSDMSVHLATLKHIEPILTTQLSAVGFLNQVPITYYLLTITY